MTLRELSFYKLQIILFSSRRAPSELFFPGANNHLVIIIIGKLQLMPAIAVMVLGRKDFWSPRWAFSGYTTAFPFHQFCALCNKFCQTLYESVFRRLLHICSTASHTWLACQQLGVPRTQKTTAL